MMRLYLLLALAALTAVVILAVRRARNPRLAELERKAHLLVAALQAKYPDDLRVVRLAYRWDGHLTPLVNAGAGRTLDKRAISLCTRDLDRDPDTATLVLTHELSHVCTESEGHTPEFWNNFRFILKEAVAAGLYHYQNFENAPVTFCGSKIESSPLTCVMKGTCD